VNDKDSNRKRSKGCEEHDRNYCLREYLNHNTYIIGRNRNVNGSGGKGTEGKGTN
jgi:hypothetical protein